ncbi:tyrosine-type recombinase/integrase [Paenibacillus sp. KN14-4R]|uniref:tyrosine-type recombinase/integrase n=1 Tax=Paenibacillus sp. KN14-4R TaxID=3445773 RepID=UPI003FA11586
MVRVRKVIEDERVTWADALDGFLTWKTAEGISEQTYEDYDKCVRLFIRRFPNAWDSVECLSESLLAHLSDEIKPATFNNRLVYLRTFLNWCVEKRIIESNPIKNIKKRKDEGRVVNLDISVIQQLLALPNQKTFVGLRDYTLILMTLDNGIRPKEAMSLLPMDFSLAASEVRIPASKAKTRVSRTLPLSEPTVKSLKRLLAARPPEWGSDVPIFCSYEGNQMTRHTWGDRMEIYCKQLGTRLRPYDLRHVFSLQFIRNGANAFTLQKALGHSNLAMTQRYVALIESDIKEEHAKATPLLTLLPEKKRIKNLDK